MSQREITDSELINGSMGVHGDIHDNKTNCKPILKRAWYSEGSYPVCEVLAYFRYCNCGNYNQVECERILKNFRQLEYVYLLKDSPYIDSDALMN